MTLEIIKKLVESENVEDNMLGFSYMQDYSFEEILDFIGRDESAKHRAKFYRQKVEYLGIDCREYSISDKYHVHDYGTIVFIYKGAADKIDRYIRL